CSANLVLFTLSLHDALPIFVFNAIKGNTKNSQSLFAGVTNWNVQYEASIQSADNHTYFPVTNAQAANIPLGTCVSVGYGGNNSGNANNDRGKAKNHQYADEVEVFAEQKSGERGT